MTKAKILLLECYICIASISAAIITPALPSIEKTFSLSHGSIGWIVSIFLLGYVIGQLIYGPIANRYGRLNALRSGLIINIIGIIVCLISLGINNYFLLLVGRLVTAFGAAAGLSCTFILINELLTKEQAKAALSMAMVSFTVGLGLSVTIAGVITQYFHWQFCFGILLLHGIAMFILTWQFPEPLKTRQSLKLSSILCGYIKTLKSKQLIKYALIVGFTPTISYCYSTIAPIYTQSVLHLSASQYGYWNLLNMIGMLASGFLSAHLIKKWHAEKLIKFSLIFIVPCIFSLVMLSITSHPNPLWFFSTTLFLYLFGGLLFPAGSYLASNAIQDKANASSMMSFINMGTAMVSVIIMGYLPTSSISAFIIVLSGFFMLVMGLLGTTTVSYAEK